MVRKSVSGTTTMVSVSGEVTLQEETLTVLLRGKKPLIRIRDMYEEGNYVDNLISNNAIEQEQKEMTVFWHFISEIQIEIRKNTGLILIGRISFGMPGQIQKDSKKSISSLNGYKRI